MTIKLGAKDWTIKEQIIEDQASGLTFQFRLRDDGKPIFQIFGDLPFGNREFIFDNNGEEAGAGTALTGLCRANWIREIVS